jgi:hypothetical protein
MRIVYSNIIFIFNHFTQPIKINFEHFLEIQKRKIIKRKEMRNT